ncbi:MAG: amino acid ABC transporter permease [Lachnospiraceae bacterium]|nr:amino acid ABC transporter permease [Lachnospiraceae bacterium]
MSMDVLTILQFVSVLFWYLLLTTGIPALIFHRKAAGLGLSVRFFFYFLIGNFSLMNLVFALQLLHISNRVTLVLGTCLIYGIAERRLNHRSWHVSLNAMWRNVELVLSKRMGMRTFFLRILQFLGEKIRCGVRFLRAMVRGRSIEWMFFLAVTILVLWQYGSNLLENYAYCASDVVVHNYWINGMSQGEIFIAGVYPFGFHCIIYYLHAVIGMDTYVLLRVFCLVQTLLVHYSLLTFLKVCCKNRYIPYVGVGAYAGLDVYSYATYWRFCSSLPQEFGMIFILPSIFFLFLFFQTKKEELDRAALPGQDQLPAKDSGAATSFSCLAAFAISFSMTISAHFYNTMIAGIFCACIAVGYCFRLFRKQYFGRVMIAGILSVVLAVLPMGIAVAQGTPLQGSLRWGMNVISSSSGSSDSEEETETETEKDAEEESRTETETATETETNIGEESGPAEESATEVTTEDIDGAESESGSSTDNDKIKSESQKEEEDLAEESEYAEEESDTGDARLISKTDLWQGGILTKSSGAGDRVRNALTRIYYRINGVFTSIRSQIKYYVLDTDVIDLSTFLVCMIAVIPFVGVLFLMRRKSREYGARLLSTGLCLGCLGALLAAGMLGLPSLMDSSRSTFFLAYLSVAAVMFFFDAVWSVLTCWLKNGRTRNTAAILVIVLAVSAVIQKGLVRNVEIAEAFGTNEAVICLTNIIHDNEDFTWTICSANDELRMGEDHGYHYEISDFLYAMEYTGEDGEIIIPTQHVYFFIEKTPVDYNYTDYLYSGRTISEEGAERLLPYGSTASIYQWESRWIMMSRMYYWAQAFAELYPNEFKVYYETDDFVCYYIEQNTYYLYNFAIDYGYNNVS